MPCTVFGDLGHAEQVDSGFGGIFSAIVFSLSVVDLTLLQYDIEFQGFNKFGRRSFDKSSVFVVIFSQPSPTTLRRETTSSARYHEPQTKSGIDFLETNRQRWFL